MAGRVRTGLTAREGRRFGLTVGIAFLVITGFLIWREHLFPARITGGLGGLLVLAGLLIPTRLGPVERAWMGLAHAISKVTTPIFMGLVYFLVMTPIGIMRRTFGSNPMVHGAADVDTYWQDKDPTRSGGLERQF